MLEVTDLSVSYDSLRALRGVSLRVDRHECVSVVGANGAGKTTLVKAIIGLVRRDGGRIVVDGQDVTGASPDYMTRLGIAVVPEGRRLFPGISARENLEIGAYFASRNQRRERLARVLDIFPQLKGRLGQPAGLLSGGEQMMVAIGRALMSQPRLLILDEPSLGLAPRTVSDVFLALQGLKNEGCAILLVEQNVRKALAMSDRAYIMENGRIALEGDDLLHHPDVQRAYLGVG